MKIFSLKNMLAICAVSLIVSLTIGCVSAFATETIPVLTPISTPERVMMIGGEIDPCLLINLEEVETVIDVKVTSEEMFMDYMPSCKYSSKASSHNVLLIVSAVTDASIKKANQPWLKESNKPISAVEVYEREIIAVSMQPEMYKPKDLSDLGDKAFLYESSCLVINVLKNNIFYQFNGYGVDYDTLVKLIKIGLERMP